MAKESPETYLDPDVDFEAILAARGICDYAEPTHISAIHPISLTPSSDGPPHRADIQALDFYRSLVGMTPRTATDERMWAWMTPLQVASIQPGTLAADEEHRLGELRAVTLVRRQPSRGAEAV